MRSARLDCYQVSAISDLRAAVIGTGFIGTVHGAERALVRMAASAMAG